MSTKNFFVLTSTSNGIHKSGFTDFEQAQKFVCDNQHIAIGIYEPENQILNALVQPGMGVRRARLIQIAKEELDIGDFERVKDLRC